MVDRDSKSNPSADEPADENAERDPLLDMLRPIVNRPDEHPAMIRRYRVIKPLGAGAFGNVYLAHDDQLQRDVAIKVPAAKYLKNPVHANAYLEEARVIAGLEHPNIVPVFDVGSTYDFPCFIVTKYVKGKNLAQFVKRRIHAGKKTEPNQAIKLIITIAKALHFAHRNGVVHRDVKPENILIDTTGKPYLVDLGLALTDANVGTGPQWIGTPAYMSPEQARGEGHRVDGRTDVYSLGVILYELLIGKRPFVGTSSRELIENITQSEAKPLRQIDDRIAIELERICLKSIAKRASDRYTTARDFADDLKAFLDGQTMSELDGSPDSESGSTCGSSRASTIAESKTATPPSRVIPKGLRSFDGHDADFFLKLLPGVVDRDGLPESIRFWKSQIEPGANWRTFDVGLIFGPSGCGKSSLVQAGLIPSLSESIRSIVVESTTTETESRLQQALRQAFPALPQDLDLVESFKRIRTDDTIRNGQKLLVVIDQFEQWLHANVRNIDPMNLPELANAIRQSDGQTIQVILLVRDDFWMSITRFMRAIEVKLSEGFNTAGVELFDSQHARKVLYLFGAAYEKLPDDFHEISYEQSAFLTAAIDEISENGQTTCIKVALLAEILKSRDWNLASLKNLGGISGIGVQYLDQTFDSGSTPPHFRQHQETIQKILSQLLPADSVSIRGQRVDVTKLARSSGLETDSAELRDVIKILDRETRILTLADADSGDICLADSASGNMNSGDDTSRNAVQYQLTHDYLVPSIRTWIKQKQSQTRQGRTRNLLKDYSDAWNLKPETRRLPGLAELVNIHRFTRAGNRSPAQKKMIRSANRYYSSRIGSVVILLAGVWFAVSTILGNAVRKNQIARADALVEAFYTAPNDAIPYAFENLNSVREESIARLENDFEATDSRDIKLRSAIGLTQFGFNKLEYLVDALADCSPGETRLIVSSFANSPSDAINPIHVKIENAETVSVKLRYVLAAMNLGDFTATSPVVAITPTPDERNEWIISFSNGQHQWSSVVDLLENSRDPSTRSAVLLGLSLCSAESVDPQHQKQFAKIATQWYTDDRSSIVHSASRLLLEKWEQPVPNIKTVALDDETDWMITPHGHTMIRVPPASTRRWNSKYFRTTKQEIWISESEVSSEQFVKFYDDSDTDDADKPYKWVRRMTPQGEYSVGGGRPHSMTVSHIADDQPINYVSLQDAFMYCNWLSRREGLKPCYERTEEPFLVQSAKGIHEAPAKRSVYWVWKWKLNSNNSGYRLPYSDEWLVAANSLSDQKYFFGSDVKFATTFAVVAQPDSGISRTTTQRCRSRLPNNLGIFDMIGNVEELCHDRQGGMDTPFVGRYTCNMGNNFKTPAQRLQFPEDFRIAYRNDATGFRIVRQLR